MPDPRVLVTGASSGIGAAIARQYAARGRDLVLVARRRQRLEELAAELGTAHGVEADVLCADLASADAPGALVAGLAERELAVDRLVNNAGFGQQGTVEQIDDARQLAMIDLNVRGLVELTLLLLPELRQRGGAICNVASTAAFQPGPWMATYYATKAFVLHWSEALHAEERGRLRVCALCPGPTRTGFAAEADMQDSFLFRHLAMDVDRVARAAVRGTEQGRAIVVPGLLNRLLIGSVRLMPRWLVRRIVAQLQQGRTQR